MEISPKTKKYHSFFSVMQLGIRADGIKDLFGDGIPGFKGDYSMSDLMAIFSVVSDIPRSSPQTHTLSWCSDAEQHCKCINCS